MKRHLDTDRLGDFGRGGVSQSSVDGPVGATHDRWRRAPVGDLAHLCADRPILILAPHADDETIGCGGLILQARAAGLPVFLDILTDGSRSHPNSKAFDRARLAALRRTEGKAAAACLGVADDALRFWDIEDSALPSEGPQADDLVADLRMRLRETDAHTVFVTWVDDPHCDHKAAFALATKAVAGRDTRLIAYPVWSWTVDLPRHVSENHVIRLDIAADLATKRRALACHASQCGAVITDDPAGFVLREPALSLFMQPFETYIEVAS